MKKFIRSICNLLLVLGLLVPTFMSPFVLNVDAADNRTIKSILADIEKQKKELQENKNKQKLTNEQILTIKNNISLISNEITKGQNEIIEINNQIAILENQIEEKDAEMKKVINFLQLSDGESQYLEYIFGATSFTDFIYRVAITEQLTNYNNKLIKEYNELIESNKKHQADIKKKEEELTIKQNNLQKEVSKLQYQVTQLGNEQGSLEEGILKSEASVRALIADGCDENETVDACYTRLKTLPSDTSFWRPLFSASITSVWGSRRYWYNGRWVESYHYGLDLGTAERTKVYSVANGTVGDRAYWSGTGYVLYVYHKVNGVKYTSVYEHLCANCYAVNKGDNVTKDTVIAYSGNTGQSTGPHLHLGMLYGWAGIEYSYWDATYYAKLFDPRTVINFPSGYGSFSTRNRNCSLGSC